MELIDIDWSFWAGVLIWVLGVVGAIHPLFPGVPLTIASVCIWWWGDDLSVSPWLFWGTIVLGVLIFLLENLIPSKLVKMSGGSRYASWGAFIGGILGATVLGFVFTPILGIPIFTVLGAIIAELLSGNTGSKAIRSGVAAGLGFMIGVGMKIVYALLVLVLFIF